MNEGIKQGRMKAPKDREIDEGSAQRTNERPTSRHRYISSTQRAHRVDLRRIQRTVHLRRIQRSGSSAEDPEDGALAEDAEGNMLMDAHSSVLVNGYTSS